MKERLAKAEALFHRALELSPEQRGTFLQTACANDAELLSEVSSLLRAAFVADDWLKDNKQARSPRCEEGDLHEHPGTIIGRYKLLEKIGEGGFGAVYMAEQQEPVRRRVALKIIKLGMDTRSVIARFEAERQALALMDHPNIAKVLDAGATDTGRPYFVMELVRGVPITQFCEEKRLRIDERLKLFSHVCGAIQHAHQKGIIHRDIKPTNILVTLNPDGSGHPMVIDFGVAKAINQRLTERTLFTNFAQMIGTPAYMSPEQAEMSKLDVDTRSDVYSLGVLLYELLTGTTPFSEERLRNAGYAEMQRIICEEQPERPSTRLTRQLAAADSRTPASSASLRASHSTFATDLDWIVMKCLEKDPARRYDATSALALDIERYLNTEPILARPPSRMYRFQKLVRRNKLAFGAGAAIALALVVGLGLSTWLFLRERAALKVADINARRAVQKAEESRRNLYAADMLLAQAALEAGNIGRAKELLSKYLPKPGEKDLRGWEWRYAWNQCRGDDLFTLETRHLAVSCLALSTNGAILASGGGDGKVAIWDLKTRTPTLTLPQADDPEALAFSRDEKELIVGTRDGQVTFWNCETWQPTATLTNLSRVRALKVSPDGRLLAVFGTQRLTLWDLANHRRLTRLPVGGSTQFLPGGVAFSPDSSLLAYSRGDGRVVLWDIATTNRIAALEGHERYVTALAFSPDGSILVSGSRDRTVRLWDVASRKELRQLGGFTGFVIGLAFSPDGAFLAVVGGGQHVRLFETQSWEEINTLKGHSDAVRAVVFHPDGKTMLTCSLDATIKCWSVSTNQRPASQRLPSDLYGANLLTGARGLYLAHTNKTYSFWRTDPLQEVARHPFPHTSITMSATSPDGKLWLAGTTNGFLRVFDHGKQRFIADLPFPATPPLPANAVARVRFAFSTDGRTLAALGNDHTCRVWKIVSSTQAGSDNTTFQQIAEFGTRNTSVWSRVIFSPSGMLLGLGYDWGWADIWRIPSGEKLAQVQGDPWPVLDMAFSRDDSTLVTASGSGKAMVWDSRSGRKVATLSGELGSLQSVAFSPDESRLATCGGEGTVRIWDVETRQQVATLKLYNERLDMLGFREDDTLMALAADAYGRSQLFFLRAPRDSAPVLGATLFDR